ncbi:DNA-directed RNA polymerase III subunit RPC4 [Coemansia sp. BCRC 34490]|nr:DNA-directed RNA polymerase III subunit RPC4 [Coemansia sp. BCRC 34490]
MPELPDEKPASSSARGSSSAAARGRGRGRARPTVPATAPGATMSGTLPSQRLGSIRGTPGSLGSAVGRTASSVSSASSSNTTGGNGGPKLRFKPNIPARRNKKDAPELAAEPTEPVQAKLEPRGVGSDRGRGRGRGRFELIQTVSGPFAQGPASLGGFGGFGAQARRSGAGGMFNMGMLPPGVSGAGGGSGSGKPKGVSFSSSGLTGAPGSGDGSGPVAEPDDDVIGFGDPNAAPVCVISEHNENTQTDEFEVQTEEMAIRAMDEIKKRSLDYFVAAALGAVDAAGKSEDSSSSNVEEEDAGRFELYDKTLVFQLPAMPEFELGEHAMQQRTAEKQRRIAWRKEMAAAAAATAAALAATTLAGSQEDVKPSIKDLEAPDAGDVKPDISALQEKDSIKAEKESEDKEDSGEADDDDDDVQLDGRIGTLVVLKSGAVKLKIGDILLDVSKGASTRFLRGLLAVDIRGPNSAFMLGNIDEQLVCTPDLDSFLHEQ